MKIINHFRSEKGSITMFVLTAMLLFLSIAFATYYQISNKLVTQNRNIDQIQEEYMKNLNNEKMEEQYQKILSSLSL